MIDTLNVGKIASNTTWCGAGFGRIVGAAATSDLGVSTSQVTLTTTYWHYESSLGSWTTFANTNTYAPVDKLRKIYNEALDFPAVSGISIGTRADCLGDDIIDLLCEINSQTELTVELGMQTIHEKTIKNINRGYSHKEFIAGYYKLKERNIRVCLHIINGLPDESSEMMLETAQETARLNPDAVKIQMLHIINGTKLAEIYNNSPFPTLTRDEYIAVTAQQLAVLPPETVVERITGDGDKSKLIAPLWTMDKIAVLGGIDKALCQMDLWQGKYYTNAKELLV